MKRENLLIARQRLSAQVGRHGAFRDKLIRDRIAQIDRDLAASTHAEAVVHVGFRYIQGPIVDSVAYVIAQIRKPG